MLKYIYIYIYAVKLMIPQAAKRIGHRKPKIIMI